MDAKVFTCDLQALSLLFAIFELESDGAGAVCCSRIFDHPVNVNFYVRMGQWFALAFSVRQVKFEIHIQCAT